MYVYVNRLGRLIVAREVLAIIVSELTQSFKRTRERNF